VRLGVLEEVELIEADEPGAGVWDGVSVIVGVGVGVWLGVGVDVWLGVGVPVDVGVGVGLEETEGTMTWAAWPLRRSCTAQPSPARSVVQGVEPHGCAVGPY